MSTNGFVPKSGGAASKLLVFAAGLAALSATGCHGNRWGLLGKPYGRQQIRAIWVTRWDYKSPADIARVMDNCKSAGFNTGVPAPAGAGLAFVPIFLWLITGNELFRRWELVIAWTIFIALLMISSIPTYSWASLRIRSGWRLFALAGIALLGAALIVAPWISLLVVAILYLAMLPFSIASYARVRRRRAVAAAPAGAGDGSRPAD